MRGLAYFRSQCGGRRLKTAWGSGQFAGTTLAHSRACTGLLAPVPLALVLLATKAEAVVFNERMHTWRELSQLRPGPASGQPLPASPLVHTHRSEQGYLQGGDHHESTSPCADSEGSEASSRAERSIIGALYTCGRGLGQLSGMASTPPLPTQPLTKACTPGKK